MTSVAKKILLSFLLVFVAISAAAKDKNFVLVIDAGHGGHDAGALGIYSKEKDINLSIALELGRLVKQNCSDVKVIFTRSTDVFIPLYKRPDIANKAKADLFISIHTNSVPKSAPRTARGVETYTNGVAQSKANMAVAQRENSVILMESDYKTRYQGFDNSPESYIMFEVMQDQYMEKSVELARHIQRQLHKSGGRPDRGVHQASLAVLRLSAMPSVLVEVGFISTRAEEDYLNTKEGIRTSARCIYNGFIDYRNKHDRAKSKLPLEKETEPAKPDFSIERPAVQPDVEEKQAKPAETKPEVRTSEKPETESKPKQEEAKPADDGAPAFKVQFLTSPTPLKKGNARLKGLDNVDYYKEGGLCKYVCGSTGSYNEARTMLRQVRERFPDAFIVAFSNGNRMDLQEAIRMSKKK